MGVLTDAGQKLFAAFRVRVTPFGFIIDPEGIVRAKGLLNSRDHIEILLENAARTLGTSAAQLFSARGPEGPIMEAGAVNGSAQELSP